MKFTAHRVTTTHNPFFFIRDTEGNVIAKTTGILDQPNDVANAALLAAAPELLAACEAFLASGLTPENEPAYGLAKEACAKAMSVTHETPARTAPPVTMAELADVLRKALSELSYVGLGGRAYAICVNGQAALARLAEEGGAK